MLWGFVAVTTSVTKAAKRKVSHRRIISEIYGQKHHYSGAKGGDKRIGLHFLFCSQGVFKTILVGHLNSWWMLQMFILSQKLKRVIFYLKKTFFYR